MSEQQNSETLQPASVEKKKRFRPRKQAISKDEPTRQPVEKVPPKPMPDNAEELLKPKAKSTTTTVPKNEPLEISETLVLNLSGLSLRPGKLAYKTDASGYIALVNVCYAKLCDGDRYFMRSVSPAMFDYYCMIAYWLRMYQLRSVEGNDPRGEYSRLRALFPDDFPLPAPLAAYLAGLGGFTDPSGRQFYLDQTMPHNTNHWQGFRGSFGQVGQGTIDHYTSNLSPFPIMYRLYAETVPNEWIDAHYEYTLPGHFAVGNGSPNSNLAGWKPMLRPHPDAVQELRRLGVRATAVAADETITPQTVPAHFEGIMYVGGLAEHVATKLTKSKVLKITMLPVNRIGSTGQVGWVDVEHTMHPSRTRGPKAHTLHGNS